MLTSSALVDLVVMCYKRNFLKRKFRFLKINNLQAFYPDASDLSDAVPTLPAYQNSSTPLSLPIKDGTQMTWADVSWLALYCRKVSMLFMSVNIPSDFE